MRVLPRRSWLLSSGGGVRSRMWLPRRCCTWLWSTTCFRLSGRRRTWAALTPARQPLPRRCAAAVVAVRRGGAAPLHVLGAPGGDGPRRRRGPLGGGAGGAGDAQGGHRAPPAGLRHRRPLVPLDRGGPGPPVRQVRRAGPVRGSVRRPGHPRPTSRGPSWSPSPTWPRPAAPWTRSSSRARVQGERGRTPTSASSWPSSRSTRL